MLVGLPLPGRIPSLPFGATSRVIGGEYMLPTHDPTRARATSPSRLIKGYVYTLQCSETDAGKLTKLDVINGECERLTYLVKTG
jgi:hypothetical protein